jgi:hypothetical protein
VRDADGSPVTATVGADGTYAFPGVAPGAYRVEAAIPSGATPNGPRTRSANAENGDASEVDFRFDCVTPRPPLVVPENGSVRVPLSPTVDRRRPATVIDKPEHGTVVYDRSLGEFVHTPDSGYQGTDSFVYPGESADGRAVIETVGLRAARTPPAPRPFHSR